MFNWLKNKEKNIATSVLTIFVGGWLVLFCQTCFATLESNVLIALSDNETIERCHPTDNITDKVDEQYAQDSDHCLGVCDCDDVPASLNSTDTAKSPDKFKNTSFYDNIVALSNESEQEIVRATYPIAIFPEQAIILPLKHFTVLLI